MTGILASASPSLQAKEPTMVESGKPPASAGGVVTILDWLSARMATAPVRPAPPRSHFEKRILAAADYLEGKPVKLIAADRKTTPATVYKAVAAFGLPYRKPKHSAAMRARAGSARVERKGIP